MYSILLHSWSWYGHLLDKSLNVLSTIWVNVPPVVIWTYTGGQKQKNWGWRGGTLCKLSYCEQNCLHGQFGASFSLFKNLFNFLFLSTLGGCSFPNWKDVPHFLCIWVDDNSTCIWNNIYNTQNIFNSKSFEKSHDIF